MEYLVALIILGLLGVIWFIKGITNDRRKEIERQVGEFNGVIDVRRNAKNKLRTDDAYRDELHDKYND